MTSYKYYADFISARKKTDSYWVESAKLDFSSEMEKRRKVAGLSNLDVAKKIGASAAYISKVFKGDANFTIESMVKLSRATGGKLQIKIVDENVKVDSGVWAGKIHTLGASNQSHNSSISTQTTFEDYKEAA